MPSSMQFGCTDEVFEIAYVPKQHFTNAERTGEYNDRSVWVSTHCAARLTKQAIAIRGRVPFTDAWLALLGAHISDIQST